MGHNEVVLQDEDKLKLGEDTREDTGEAWKKAGGFYVCGEQVGWTAVSKEM